MGNCQLALDAYCWGRVNWKVEPTSGLLSSDTLPPCASMNVLTIARPRPKPPQQVCVRVNDQAVRDFIDKLGAAGSGHGTKIVDEGFDQ